jgi:hypothetical protein
MDTLYYLDILQDMRHLRIITKPGLDRLVSVNVRTKLQLDVKMNSVRSQKEDRDNNWNLDVLAERCAKLLLSEAVCEFS